MKKVFLVFTLLSAFAATSAQASTSILRCATVIAIQTDGNVELQLVGTGSGKREIQNLGDTSLAQTAFLSGAFICSCGLPNSDWGRSGEFPVNGHERVAKSLNDAKSFDAGSNCH